VPTARNWSVGLDTGSSKICLYSQDANTKMYTNLIRSIIVRKSSGNAIDGVITTIDADGFTITFVEAGSSSAIIVWFAIE